MAGHNPVAIRSPRSADAAAGGASPVRHSTSTAGRREDVRGDIGLAAPLELRCGVRDLGRRPRPGPRPQS